MLFATENNPKGPDLKQLQNIAIELSGCKLNFQAPYGNMRSLIDINGILVSHANIYDTNHEQWNENNDYKSLRVFERLFNYSGFIGQGVGNLKLTINAHCLLSKDNNLLSNEAFKNYIKKYTEAYCNVMNNVIKDPLLQLPIPHDFSTTQFNTLNFLHYTIQKPGIERSQYHLAIFEDCHLEFIFNYGSPHDKESSWFKMANALEQSIMNSFNAVLTDSAKLAKTSSA